MTRHLEFWQRCGGFVLTLALAGCSGAELDIAPQHFSQCQGVSTTVHVKWQVPDGEPIGAKIYIAGVSHSPTIWKVVPASGEADTPNAIYDGTTFTLRSASGVRLARRTVTSSLCTK